MSNTDNMLYAADSANMQSGGRSFFDEATDAIVKGGGAALVSGLSSIYNTGVDVTNYFGGDADRIDVHKALENVDQNWGDYYAAHQGTIDAAGFLATSIIPGGLAVKGLNLVRRGEGAGSFARALNYTTAQQTKNLEAALQTIASPEGSVFTKMNKNYLSALAWGTADQVLQTAAFEIAVATTMKASPILDGQSYKDISHDIVTNALFGGAIGGTIEGILMSSIAKNATRAVGATQRKYDLLGASESLSVSASDKAYSFIDAALQLPEEVFANDRTLEFTYRLNGRQNTLPGGLQTGQLYDQALERTIKNAKLTFQKIITDNLSAEGDLTVTQPFSNAMIKLVNDGLQSGAPRDSIRARLGDHVFNLETVEPIGAKLPDVTPEGLFYFDPTKQAKLGEFPLSKEKKDDLRSFRVIGEPTELKLSTAGFEGINTVKQAWEAGYDLFAKTDGTWAINPKSPRVKATQEPTTFQTIFNTVTGKASDTVNPTIADVATKEAPLLVRGDRVISGEKVYDMKIGDEVGSMVGADSTYYTARHLWADSLKKIEGTVDATDISVLDKMSSAKQLVDDGTMVNVGGDLRNWRDLGNFDDFVFNNKLKILQERLGAGEKDISALAYELNTTPKWIQDSIASKFNFALKKSADNAPDLTSGWQRQLESYGDRENLILNYKKAGYSNVMDDFGNALIPKVDAAGMPEYSYDGQRAFITGSQAYQYRIRLAQDNLNMAFGSVFSEDAQKFIEFAPGELEKLANNNTTGAGIVSFSNADYGDKIRLFSQETGKQTHLLTQKISNEGNTVLQPLMANIKNDPKAAAELTAIVTRLRRSSEKFTVIDGTYLGDAEGAGKFYLIDKSLVKNTAPEDLAALRDQLLSNTQDKNKAFSIDNESVGNFLQSWMGVIGGYNEKRGVLAVARGQVGLRQSDTLYVPPIDTQKVPYFAFVRPTDGKAFSDSSVSMITARTDKELQQLVAQIKPEDGLEVVFKKDTEKFFKAKGDYDFQRNLSESTIDSQLRSQGRLGDYLPSFSAESTLEDFLNFHQRQAAQLVRDGVSTKYAQQIAEFQRLSDQFTVAQTSEFRVTDKLLGRTLKDPYGDIIKGMMDISKRSEFTLLHQTNEMLDALGVRAYRAAEGAFQSAAAGNVSWQEANSVLTKYGLGAPFKDSMAYEVANIPADRNLLKVALQKANMLLTNGVLRLDFANSLINVISTPIMLGTEVSSIRNSIKNDVELAAKFNDNLSVGIPGGGGSIPSSTKMIFQAVRNYWGPEAKTLLERYKTNGDINSVPAMFHEMTNDLSLVPGLVPKDYAEGVNKWIEKASKITLNTQAEQFTRFVSADVMRQMTQPVVEAGKMSIQEQNAFISIFVNRVQGNYIASQRPILFQGTLGSAVGLFQTYQFNMMQQLFRHIENRDLKTIAVMGGLQSSIYGLNGLPAFEAINTHILGNAAINDGHRDSYSFATQAAGKEMGDWMMYGTASAFPFFGKDGPALYTRGDVNPRHPTVIPVTPQDIPAVDASIRFVKNLVATAGKITNGGNIGASLLEGLEHNSINRPLAGLAQALNGASTTSQGSLISGNQDLFSIANASRILGAKPLDESIGLNDRYRTLAYQAEDKARIEQLGSAVKTTLRGNNSPSDEQMTDFMGKYAASGGRVENFGSAMQRWSKDANQSVLNQLSDKVKSPYGQRFVEVMGGSRLPDYRELQATPPEP